ncbi:putative zinc finger/helix-turn-helix YgiT family protein [Skermanella aerolata]
MHERIAQMQHVQGSRKVLIENDRHMFCESCGNVSYLGDQISQIELTVARKIREEDGLLPPQDLKAIRLKYNLTQAEMEQLISAGPKTWVRWERGKVVQSKVADTLIRQIAEQPDLVRSLLSRSGVASAAAQQVLAAIDEDVERQVAEMMRQRLGPNPAVDIEMLVRDTAEAIRRSQREVTARIVRAA